MYLFTTGAELLDLQWHVTQASAELQNEGCQQLAKKQQKCYDKQMH